MLADELVSRFNDAFYFNKLLDGGTNVDIWNSAYRILLFRINAVMKCYKIGCLAKRSEGDFDWKAKITRAFIYFNLVNLFGDIPLVLTADFTLNSNIGKSTVKDVYAQIIRDLLDAPVFIKSGILRNKGSDYNYDL